MTPKEKVSRAVGEPKGAPKELVESMVATVKAVLAGREAEKNLKTLGDAAPPNTVRDLAAFAAVGRLAQNNRLPAGADPAKLADQMKALPAFEELTNRSSLDVQHDLETGKFTDDLTRASENGLAGIDLVTETESTLDAPEMDAPEKQAPLM